MTNLSDTSAQAPVEVKAVWEADGKFHTLRLKGLGRVESERYEEETFSSSLFYRDAIPVQDKYRFIVDIEDTFTIQTTDEDPRERRVSANLEVINIETLKVLMAARKVPEDASIEIDPFDGGNLVTFKWKEL